MRPAHPLPYRPDLFATPDAYIASLLHLLDKSRPLRTFCGGVHILDFFTAQPPREQEEEEEEDGEEEEERGHVVDEEQGDERDGRGLMSRPASAFGSVVPRSWRAYLLGLGTGDLLGLLMGEDEGGEGEGEDGDEDEEEDEDKEGEEDEDEVDEEVKNLDDDGGRSDELDAARKSKNSKIHDAEDEHIDHDTRRREEHPPSQRAVPPSLVRYIRQVRRHILYRKPPDRRYIDGAPILPRHVAVGMIPKKQHEVATFAKYVESLCEAQSEFGDMLLPRTKKAGLQGGPILGEVDHDPESRLKEARVYEHPSSQPSTTKFGGITHIIDFGSGQNYLGRALASPPYHRHVVAVESREVNMRGARSMDVLAGMAEREKVRRNKRAFRLEGIRRALEDGAEVSAKEFTLLRKKERRLEARRRRGKVVEEEQEGERQDEREEDGERSIERLREDDVRPKAELEATYPPSSHQRGSIQYIRRRLENGNLEDVIKTLEQPTSAAVKNGDMDISTTNDVSASSPVRALVVSIHSCGNLSHHGIRSLILNPAVKAVAIIGCCYNLLTSAHGTNNNHDDINIKHPLLRPDLRALNAFTATNSAPSSSSSPPTSPTNDPPSFDVKAQGGDADPHGFPMSRRLRDHEAGRGVRFGITARTMAVQAPGNWTPGESDQFYERHYWRALLQKMMLDFGVVRRVAIKRRARSGGVQMSCGDANGVSTSSDNNTHPTKAKATETKEDVIYATEPVIVGTLKHACFRNGFAGYVHGALEKLLLRGDGDGDGINGITSSATGSSHTHASSTKSLHDRLLAMQATLLADPAIITRYEQTYDPCRRELSIVWTLMAFSAQLVESIIVVDRWLFLREHMVPNATADGSAADDGGGECVVRDAWVEPVFEYGQSPRNLVVVGVK